MTKEKPKKPKTTQKAEKIDVYQIVTNRIIEELEKGVIPWRKPWVNHIAVNWVTQKPYRGINILLLPPGEYATYKQITEAGGKLKKGAKSQIVVFWKWLEYEDEETEEKTKIPYLRYYKVFNVLTQVEGLEGKRNIQEYKHDPIEEAESIYKNYMDAPDFTFKSGKAVYYPLIDRINVPPMKDFPNVNEYYCTLFHEMIHSTGHKSRLDRPGIAGHNVAFGDEVYSKEELVAEIGAAMLCNIAGIDNHTIQNSASYIQSWLRALKDDKKLIVQAAANAQKAADYIRNIKFD